MGDRSALAALRAVSEIRRLITDLAAQAALQTAAVQRQDEHAQHLAEQDLMSAAATWSDYMGEHGFDPVIGGLLARQVLAFEMRVSVATARVRESEAQALRSLESYRTAQAEREVGRSMLQTARKSYRRKQDEKILANLEDIVTYRRAMP